MKEVLIVLGSLVEVSGQEPECVRVRVSSEVFFCLVWVCLGDQGRVLSCVACFVEAYPSYFELELVVVWVTAVADDAFDEVVWVVSDR